jgi:hypothetical protein
VVGERKTETEYITEERREMSYHNPSTRGSSIRGFSAISPKIGKQIWDQMLVHDDGMLGFGGTRTLGVGGQGSGKTTLNTKFARKSFYIEGINKNDFIKGWDPDNPEEWLSSYAKNIHPETVLWRGREFDSWNTLVPHIYAKCYPEESFIKPLRVHVYRGNKLTFYEQNTKTSKFHEIKNLDIAYYSTIRELHDDILEGGNNIIYPPGKHYLSSRLKDILNTKQNLSKTDRKYLKMDEKYLVERDIFLFELFEYIFRSNLEGSERKWYTVIVDESHDLLRSNSPGLYYWIIDWFVDILVDTRRWNLSLVCQTHGLTLIDWRILERFSHFLWLRGCRPSASYSQVDPRVVRKLQIGQGINESISDGSIGAFEYNRIPNNVSRLVVSGMTQQKELSTEITDDDFVAVTEGSRE